MVTGIVLRTILLSVCLGCLTGLNPAFADNHGSVRIYKLNSKDQLLKQRWVKDGDQPGCHDVRRRRSAHRFAQVGYSWCAVFTGDKCKSGTEVAAMWRGGKYRTADIDISLPQIRLLPGSRWYLDESKNIQIGSWFCEY